MPDIGGNFPPENKAGVAPLHTRAAREKAASRRFLVKGEVVQCPGGAALAVLEDQVVRVRSRARVAGGEVEPADSPPDVSSPRSEATTGSCSFSTHKYNSVNTPGSRCLTASPEAPTGLGRNAPRCTSRGRC